MSFIEGARRITSLAHRADAHDDPDIPRFILIDSETDTLPIGDVRKLWRIDALEKLQPEINRAEAWARETGIDECESLIARFRGAE